MTKRTIENSRLRRIVMVFGLGAVAIALGGGISWWLALFFVGCVAVGACVCDAP